MFWTTKVMTLAYALAKNFLLALTTRPAGALLTTPTMHLYTARTAPITPQSTVSEFTEATFVGYAAVTMTFSAPLNLPAAAGVGVLSTGNFIAGALTATQNVIGYWIDDTAGNFYGAEDFSAPVPIASPGDFVSVDAIIPILNPATV